MDKRYDLFEYMGDPKETHADDLLDEKKQWIEWQEERMGLLAVGLQPIDTKLEKVLTKEFKTFNIELAKRLDHIFEQATKDYRRIRHEDFR